MADAAEAKAAADGAAVDGAAAAAEAEESTEVTMPAATSAMGAGSSTESMMCIRDLQMTMLGWPMRASEPGAWPSSLTCTGPANCYVAFQSRQDGHASSAG